MIQSSSRQESCLGVVRGIIGTGVTSSTYDAGKIASNALSNHRKIDSRNHPNSVLTSVVDESVEIPSYAMTENRLVEDSEIPLGSGVLE